VRILEETNLRAAGDPQRGFEPGAFDEYWAVFDWDGETEDVSQALKIAASGVRTALSNPAFEVWLLWHFREYMTSGCNQGDVVDALSHVWPEYRKGLGINFSHLPGGGTASAVSRAAKARQHHERSGVRFPDDRPSSELDALLKSVVEHCTEPNEARSRLP
jgi:hypothetical protein